MTYDSKLNNIHIPQPSLSAQYPGCKSAVGLAGSSQPWGISGIITAAMQSLILLCQSRFKNDTVFFHKKLLEQPLFQRKTTNNWASSAAKIIYVSFLLLFFCLLLSSTEEKASKQTRRKQVKKRKTTTTTRWKLSFVRTQPFCVKHYQQWRLHVKVQSPVHTHWVHAWGFTLVLHANLLPGDTSSHNLTLFSFKNTIKRQLHFAPASLELQREYSKKWNKDFDTNNCSASMAPWLDNLNCQSLRTFMIQNTVSRW